MTTLHALRRTYTLSFSELAILTSIPVRRLAEFEYHGHALTGDERRSLALFFGIAEHALEGGFVSRVASQPTLTQARARALVVTAAAATLLWSLRMPAGDTPLPAAHPALAAVGAPHASQLQLGLELQPSPEPTTTPVPSATAAVLAPELLHPTSLPAGTVDEIAMTHGTAAIDGAVPDRAALELRPNLAPTADVDDALQPHAPLPTPTPIPTAAPVVAALSQTLHVEQLASPPAAPAIDQTPASEALPPVSEPAVQAFHKRKPPTPTPVPPAVVASAPSTQLQASRYGHSTLTLSDNATPHRCPVVPARGRATITQGYAVGSHVPTDEWGGLDLGVAGGPTAGTTVVASHAGYVRVALNTWPGGNFVAVSGDTGWRTAYAHLETVLVQSGQYVEAGTPIGTVGSSGNTTGPHLHYETWFNGVNVDPSSVLFCK